MPSAIVIQAFGRPTMIKPDQRPRNLPQDFECSRKQAPNSDWNVTEQGAECRTIREGSADTNDRRDVGGLKPPGEIRDRFEIEGAVLVVDHMLVEARGSHDPRASARRELLEPGAKRPSRTGCHAKTSWRQADNA
jgi:hypothetical protein